MKPNIFIKATDKCSTIHESIPAPILRKSFTLDFVPEHALLSISASGFYDLYINGQKITLCLEPAMVYRAKRIEDIWFLDYGYPNNQKSEQIYPLTAFNGARELWESGLDAVYTQIAIGRYGGYNGEWISDPRKHRAFL